MADIHVAAGLPPGHGDPCSCRPIAYATPGGTIVIHRIAAPEMLRPEHPEASHALNTRARPGYQAAAEARAEAALPDPEKGG